MREFLDNLRNSEFFQSKKNLIILAVLLLALPVGIFLITQQQIFKSGASGERIEFSGPNVETRDGRKVATKPEVTLKLNTTLGQEAPQPASPAPSNPPASPEPPAPPEPTWSGNLLDSANMQNVTVSDPVTQKVQWFGPGTYTFSGAITSNTPKVQGNPTFASLQADEWTDAGSFSGVRSPGTTFTVPAGSKAAVILRAINANATFANVSLTREQEGTNLMDPSLVNSTVTQTQGAGRADPSTSQKFRIYGTVSGDGFLDVAEWTPYPNPVWQSAHQVGDPPFGISAAGNFLQVGYNVRSGSVTFSNVRFVEVTQSANLVDSDKQNATVSDPVTQKTQEFGPGTYKLSGDITANNPVVQGNPTHASIQADEWNDAGTSFIGVHEPGSTFTVPSGNKVVVILRTINANATFANVSLQKQQ